MAGNSKRSFTPMLGEMITKGWVQKGHENENIVVKVKKDYLMSETQEAPSIDLDSFTVDVQEATDNKLSGKAFYDSEKNNLVVHMPVGYSNFELNMHNLGAHVAAGRVQYRIEQIGTCDINEKLLPVCVHFIPSKSQTKGASEIPSKWKFANGFRNQSCVCPELGNSYKSPGQCGYGLEFKQCGASEFAEDKTFATVEGPEGDTVATITTNFYPPRVRKYTVGTEIFDSMEDVQQYLKSTVGENYTVNKVDEENSKKSYFKKVFDEV